ncbi:hypothetical protein C7377_0513 [Balneicella halophila]|uniref:Uncharacterized protein n=1 Tax=Balneicella halophila TaxID=1537566 RepID=A0A7L4UR15_BALHA|nr:hypothetical protein [Balneicella halophila]PVX52206.1 hypothetical protein C7377_0513 [Balneicella halophila]
MEKKRNNAGYIAAIVVLALLLIGGSVMYFQERNKNNEIQQVLEDEKQELTTELESLSAEYDKLKTTNDTLSYELEIEKAKIEKMITELKQTKNSSYAQIKKYKDEIASLKALVKEYSFQVDSLNMLSLQLAEEKDLYKEEAEKKTAVVDSLSMTNEELQKIVSRASILEPMNLEAYPANRRNKPVRRLGWTRKIKVDFTFPKNPTVEKGAKDVYVVITRPDDVIVSNPLGETFEYNDEQMTYTMKRTIYYENEVLPVSLFWDNDKSLIKGQYKADIVLDGKVIGSTSFRIK